VVFENRGVHSSTGDPGRINIDSEMRRVVENRLEARVISPIERGFDHRVEVAVGPEEVQEKENEKAEKNKIRAPFPFLKTMKKVFKPVGRHEEKAESGRKDELFGETEHGEDVVEESEKRCVFSEGQDCARDEDHEPKEHSLPAPGQEAEACQRENDHSWVKG